MRLNIWGCVALMEKAILDMAAIFRFHVWHSRGPSVFKQG